MAEPLLSVKELGYAYRLSRKRFWRAAEFAPVLRDISFTLNTGESLGIVGESGSGKTTLGRVVLRLLDPDSGQLVFRGKEISRVKQKALRAEREQMQMIFQDPQSSLNPRRRVGRSITAPLAAFDRVNTHRQREEQAQQLLARVGLDPAFARRYPHELSGGQRQRAGIARAIALEPKLIVADEIVSGLDVSSQARILALLEELKRDMGLSLIFISHDLSVVRKLCDRTLVMKDGRVAELQHTDELFRFARHPYTRELIRAIPLPEIEDNWLDTPEDKSYTGGIAMQIKNSTALVTGANRGIGKALVAALVQRGAKKVYATARDVSSIDTSNGVVEAHVLDITDHQAIANLAQQLTDVDLLINNAGINRMSAFAASDDLTGARDEMEVNYFGTLAMCRAFAPVLKANGGGAVVNLLSILARVNLPLMGSLCASKAAGLSLVQGLRAELNAQNTAVIAVLPGAVDTDMSKDFPPPKMPASDVATALLDGVEKGDEEIYPGEMASGLMQGLQADPKAVEKELAAFLPG